MRMVIAVLVLCFLVASCDKGAEALFPSTRRGWGTFVIVVGAAWIITGAAIAATSDELSTGKRIGYPLAAAGIGAGLIYLGWKLGDFGASKKPPPPPASP